MPRKKNKERGRRRGYFQSKPWTVNDIEILFEENKEFRQVAIAAARRAEGAQTAGREQALALAKSMVDASKRIGDQIGKYPHPAVLLTFLREWPDRRDKWMSANPSDVDITAAAFANLIVAGWRGPNTGLVGWDKLMHAVGGSAASDPFFRLFKGNVLPAPSSGAFTGFPLHTLRVRVPVGAKVMKNPKTGHLSVSPREFRIREIDFRKPEMVEMFGEVWIGVSKDRKSVWIASSKGASSAKLHDLIGAGTNRGSGSVPGKFDDLYPGASSSSAVPATIKRRLGAPASERGKGSSFFAG